MRVFVYGTLKPGGHYYQSICQNKISSFQEAKLLGTLYDLGVGYPAIQIGGLRWVYGYVLHFQSEEMLQQLDALEDYEKTRSPSENTYQRIQVTVYDIQEYCLGKMDTYVMEEEQLSRYQWRRIPSGNWPLI